MNFDLFIFSFHFSFIFLKQQQLRDWFTLSCSALSSLFLWRSTAALELEPFKIYVSSYFMYVACFLYISSFSLIVSLSLFKTKTYLELNLSILNSK